VCSIHWLSYQNMSSYHPRMYPAFFVTRQGLVQYTRRHLAYVSSAFVTLTINGHQTRWYPVRITSFWMILSLYYSQKVVIPTLSLQVACDLTIAASMVYYLYTRCSRVKQCVNLRCGIYSCRRWRLAQDDCCDYHARALLDHQRRILTVHPDFHFQHLVLTSPQCIFYFMPYNCQLPV